VSGEAMRTVIGWLLMALGGLAVLLGGVVASVFGSDDTVMMGPHQLATPGSAIVTAPSVLPYAGPTLLLSATSPRRSAKLFIGVGRDENVRNYLAQTTYTRIESVSLPWSVQQARVLPEGTQRGKFLGGPEQLPWWLSRSTGTAGTGSVTATVPLPDSPIDLVVMDLHHLRGFAVDMTVGVEQPGIFLAAIAVALAGVGLGGVGWVLRRSAASRR
jgi:hypothetical protein